jgi:hypothetical protein
MGYNIQIRGRGHFWLILIANKFFWHHMGTKPIRLVVTIDGEFVKIGPPYRIRTCDLRLRRAPLYPAELRADRKPAYFN